MRIRKNDTVLVTRGKNAGQRGRILEMDRKKERVLVEGVNMMKRHTKAGSRNQAGGVVEREAPIHISNVMAWCEAVNGPSKILMKTLEDGKRVRIWKVNGETLDD
ncbi:MAG: 50S ribosomal protein L24 [Candidatus Hydrogenedentes bacterium]|nr:50S ribosomal protein L24 [Candidatus Hydrogenedentota bacterium]